MISCQDFEIYLKVKDELLKEDCKIYIKDYLAERRGINPWDIDDREIKDYDYDYLIEQYKEREDGNIAPNDIWDNIIEDYIEEYYE